METNQGNEPSNPPDINALTAFYSQQWDDIYHQDSLDWRIMTVLLTAVGAFSTIITFAYRNLEFPLISIPFSLILGLVAVTLAFYGVWMTLRSWVNLQFRIANIRNAERAMRIEHLVNERTQIPRTGRRFVSRFARSRRAPLLLVYLLAMAVPVSVLLPLLQLNTLHSVILSLLIASGIVAFALYVQTSDYLGHFKTSTAKPEPPPS